MSSKPHTPGPNSKRLVGLLLLGVLVPAIPIAILLVVQTLGGRETPELAQNVDFPQPIVQGVTGDQAQARLTQLGFSYPTGQVLNQAAQGETVLQGLSPGSGDQWSPAELDQTIGTNDSPEAVIAWYVAQARASGWCQVATLSLPNHVVFNDPAKTGSLAVDFTQVNHVGANGAPPVSTKTANAFSVQFLQLDQPRTNQEGTQPPRSVIPGAGC